MLKVRPFGQWIGWALLVGIIVVSGCATPPDSGAGAGARENTVYVVQKEMTLAKSRKK